MACSALKQSYRDELSAAIPPVDLRFVLLEASRAVIEDRLAHRTGHYMSPSLLDSQIATLEIPSDALRVSVVQSPADAVHQILDAVKSPIPAKA